jgi:hypothetical protein
VFDKMKRAGERLLEVDNPPAAVATALDSIVALSDEMARTRVDAAIAASGAPHEIAEAFTHLSSATDKLADGEPAKAIDEYKKAWEKARDAGTFSPTGFRRDFRDISYDLLFALPNLSGKAADEAGDAVKELGNVYAEDKAWDTQGSPSDGDGKNVFDKAKRAAEQLLGVDDPPPSLTTAIGALVSISGTMAQARIDMAVADGGSQSKIDDALEHMAGALEKLANGEPHKAIDEYKKAWEKARDAL